MRWTVEVLGDRDLLVVRTTGRFDVVSHRAMVEDIVTRDDWHPGRDVLFDHRSLDWGRTGLAEMRAAQSNHAAFDNRIGAGRAAILMGDVASFGIGRQFALIAEDEVSAQVRAFSDEEEALRWLHGEDG